MNENGYFVVSLDFELLWGVFDVVDYKNKRTYFENTRQVLPKVLLEFSKYEIHATWAIVGMLFNSSWKEWIKNKPNSLPSYDNKQLSAYNFGDCVESEGIEKLVFAPEQIRLIKSAIGQEVGTHTYSHYYCLEEGQTSEEFKEDLQKAIDLAAEIGIELKSLVFPRNQLKKEYLQICAELGIENVRSNPSTWYWENTLTNNFLTKLARSGDAYFSLGRKSYKLDKYRNQLEIPMEQKASRFLRPVEKIKFLRKLKINRIKKEMTQAAKNKMVYHLWWHPHNFGEQPEESLKDLRTILQHFQYCKQAYGFQSANMQEINKLNKQ